MPIPNDPAILLSYINTQLRDFYPSLDELGKTLGVNTKDIEDKLALIDYRYDSKSNRFV